MYLNKAIIVGNLTRDPDLRSLPSGIPVATFSVATNRVWKDKNNMKQETADFHNVVVFGKQASTCAQFLRKGSQVLVEGRMQTRSWDDAGGSKKYRTEIVADRIQFDSRPTGAAPAPTKDKKVDAPELEVIEYPEEDINPDDIPF